MISSFAILILAAVPPPNVDAFLESDVVRPAPRTDDVFVAHVEPRLGVPSFVWAIAVGPEAPAWTRAELTPVEAARRHLLGVAPLYRLGGEAIARLEHRHTHDLGHGPLVVTFGRLHEGLPLFRDEVHVVMTRQRELVAITGNVNPAEPKEPASRLFRVSAETAVSLAAAELGLSHLALQVHTERERWQGVSDASGQLRGARVSRVWFGLPDGLEAAWYVELDSGDEAMFEVISAWNGRVLSRKNLREDDAASYRVWAEAAAPFAPDDSPYGNDFSPHPTGARFPAIEGTFVSAKLVTLDFKPGARSDPWLAATTLRGNNAFAFADLYGPYGANPPDAGLRDGGPAPVDPLTLPTSPGVFDHPWQLDGGVTARSQTSAASTHLFFTVNWLHDWLLAAGFDEAAGNGQTDNLGRGGMGNDALQLSAFSYARPNNASMSTFADGEASRMQMGNFATPTLRFIELSDLDGGRVNLTLSSPAPLTTFDLTGPVVVMQSDAGPNGCEELFDPSSLFGALAVTFDRSCPLRTSFDRAQDAGAAALLVVPTRAGFPSLSLPDASIDFPVVGLPSSPTTFVTALDAGIAFTARLYSQPQPPRPSALDTQIVTHEFGHFLSNRLISNTAGLQLQISRSMGEGWSDFLALLQTLRAADAQRPGNANWRGAFGVGAFAVGGVDNFGDALEHHWFAIRRAPYSVDTEKNGFTFRHIRDGATLPPGAIPNGAPNSEVHGAGEVWCSMLWEGFVALLRTSADFERTRTTMLETLVAAFKATPANPDFLEARDALLAVAFASDPAMFRTLYEGFARRGAGPRAIAPSKLSTNNSPVVEDFMTTDTVRVIGATVDDSVQWCDRDGLIDAGERGVLTITARNLGTSTMSAPQAVTIRALSQGVVVEGDGRATFPSAPPFGLVRTTVPVRLDTGTDVRSLEFRVDVDGASSSAPTIVTALANADLIMSATEDFEGTIALDRGAGWRRGDDLESDNALIEELWRSSPQTPTQTVLNGPNAQSTGHSWLTTPALTVGPGALTLRFRHRYQFESSAMISWDGAYLEISDDGQRTWARVPATAMSPAYPGTISTVTSTGAASTNPEAGAPAWVRSSANAPAFVAQTVNLGTAYANKTVHLRFVIATDVNGGAPGGWDVDDVELTGIMGTPFTQRVADRARCLNRAPSLDAGPDRRVNEKETVMLTADVMDPDGDVVQLEWAQVSGPTVALMGAQFVAPTVSEDTSLEFEVTARDGMLESKDRVTLTVISVNSPPRVTVNGPTLVRAGQQIVLTATAVDDDGDVLETTFVQTRGPLAKDLGGGKFLAPQVKEPDRLYFEIVVSDGRATATATTEVGLEPSSCGCTSAPLNGLIFVAAGLGFLRRRRTPLNHRRQ